MTIGEITELIDKYLSQFSEPRVFDESTVRKKLKEYVSQGLLVSTQGSTDAGIEHVEFTVRYADDEKHIRNRLEREKRCGTVEHLDNNTSRFSADVFDASEVIPWIRTFICRITDIHFSNKEMEAQFKNDIKEMYTLYGVGGDE